METQAAAAKSASINNDISIEAANSFGNLLADKLDPEIAEQTQSIGYNVFSAEVTGAEVTVKFETMSDCTLLAGIYDETKEKLIATGTAEVLTGETEKTVTIETNEMPQYFYLKVYLIDETSMRPMCTAYESSLYTKEMQEFLAKTVEDFDSERVLNLDEDEINNFAVYGEDVAVVESGEAVNAVTTADIENQKYVIENADSSITSLKIDDVVAIEQTNGEVLIVKVGEINIDGTTVTITGQDTNMEEVFDYVKIDVAQSTADSTVDTSNMSEGVSYEGRFEKESDMQEVFSGRKKSDSESQELSLYDKLNLDYESDKGVSVTAEIGMESTLNITYYYDSKSEIESVEVTLDQKYSISAAVSGAIKWEPEIPTYTYPVVGGILSFKVDLKFIIEAKMELTTEGSINQRYGFSYDENAQEKFRNLSGSPYMNFSLAMEGSIFVGFSITPKLCFVSDKIAFVGLEILVGGEISAEESYIDISNEEFPLVEHECEECLKGEIKLKLEISLVAQLFNKEEFETRIPFASVSAKISDFYNSLTYCDSGFTTCPHQLYRLTIRILNEKNRPIEALVYADGNPWRVTDLKGYCYMYFSKDEVVEIKVVDGDIVEYKTVTMPGRSDLVTININTDKPSTVTTKPITTTSNKTTKKVTTTTTTPAIKASGTCGENLTWVLDDGTLTISGTGKMSDYSDISPYAPWIKYSDKIKKVVINKGVTSIGDCAFWTCKSLTSITIPNSVTSIGECAFYTCVKLASIKIPDSVTSIEDQAFMWCTSLTSITIKNPKCEFYDTDILRFPILQQSTALKIQQHRHMQKNTTETL